MAAAEAGGDGEAPPLQEPQASPAAVAEGKVPNADGRMAAEANEPPQGAGLQVEALGGPPASEPPGRGNRIFDVLFKYQPQTEIFYTSFRVQVGVAGLIVGNFMVNIVQKQVDPKDESTEVFAPFETFFNMVFFIELIVNMYSTWFWDFWMNSWNRFDFLVVSIGMLDTLNVDLPEQLKFIRMLRAFRVFRLFARVESLNKIIVSLVHAVPGVANAFLIMTIVMAIYAILAVDLYQKVGVSDNSTSCISDTFVSGRGRCVGEEYFGTFLASFYSLFQVLTGDSWSEAIARPVILLHPYSGPLFFLTFIILNAVVLINVVVAVLVDKIMNPDEDPVAHEDPAAHEDLPALDEPARDNSFTDGDDAQANAKAIIGSAEDDADGNSLVIAAGGAQAGAGLRPASGAEKSSAASEVKSRVTDLKGDTARLREEVTQVSAALRSGLERTRADMGGLQAKLDGVLSALREAQAQQ